ncbi:winged helix-turn-helix transcriptional regulator [Flavobacterium plurextorum]|uniref:winged helix-turn-helix transcriptional regulator n=1 Tax=Flavobacterium plurextorum TaxID=1114867 RepID=UPI0037581D3A
MKEVKKRSECPISCTLDVFGDKWSFLIIRDLMFAKECTYGDFLKSAEGIATNILASRLLMLEENKVIEKLEHPKSKAKVLYKLTRKGIDLLPVLIEMHLWFEKHFPISEEKKAMLEIIKKNKTGFIENLTKNLES